MSRCYPYPSPGYSPNTATYYALIQSIKLQKDKERVKLERKKEKRREKKERKRKKKEMAKEESISRNGNWISGGDNRQLKTSYLQKDIKDEFAERLENSSLCEEKGRPVCSQDPSYSSDITQNNNKRKRSTSPSNGIHGHSTVVRIQLSSHKHGQCDISINEGDCFKESAKHDAERTSSPLLKNKQHLSPFMSVSGQPIAKDKTTIASCSKLHENDIELEFKNLILSCVPPTHEFDDQDWLFQRKHKCIRMKENGEVSNDMSCGTSALLPRAQYRDDAELYAFPFTVPF